MPKYRLTWTDVVQYSVDVEVPDDVNVAELNDDELYELVDNEPAHEFLLTREFNSATRVAEDYDDAAVEVIE
jgi:hypothetical protein